MYVRVTDAVVSSPLSSFLLPKGGRTTLGSNHGQRSLIKFQLSEEGKLASTVKPKPQPLLLVQKHKDLKVAVKASELSVGQTEEEKPSTVDLFVRLPEEENPSTAAVFLKQWDVFRRFSRDYTVLGSIAAITAVSIVPIIKMGYLPLSSLPGYLQALIVGIGINIYIVGLNQIYDVEIDKINKTHLPLASGEYSMTTGKTIVAVSGVVSFVMAYMSRSVPLMLFNALIFLLGSAYSVDAPFLRWKQNPLLAAFVIVSWRSLLTPTMFFWHMQEHVLKSPMFLAKPVLFATAFMFFFATVIALFKDIPDVEGDTKNGIKTLSILQGRETVFWLCIKLLMTAYGAAMALGSTCANTSCRIITVLGHALLASLLWSRAHSVEIKDKKSVYTYYMFIWKLFYAEYFLVPFMQ